MGMVTQEDPSALGSVILRGIWTKTRLYMDYGPGLRLIEPYACGFSGRGDGLMYGYQVGGASLSGEFVGWKTFRVDRIKTLDTDSETFEIRRDYKKNQPGIRTILAKL